VDDSKDIPGWDTAEVDDSAWGGVAVYPLSSFKTNVSISADAMEPTVRHSTVAAKSVASAAGSASNAGPIWLVEMDELFTGWFEVSNMKGAPNSTVRFRVSTTAGVPVEYGMEDFYTFGSSGTGKFRMRFAYHEIQFITISGLDTKPGLGDVVGIRLTSLGKRTGDFSCSSELISRMYDTVLYRAYAIRVSMGNSHAMHPWLNPFGGCRQTPILKISLPTNESEGALINVCFFFKKLYCCVRCSMPVPVVSAPCARARGHTLDCEQLPRPDDGWHDGRLPAP
jgi:hypothetical protein